MKMYVELEKKTGFTMMMNEKTHEENTGIPATSEERKTA